MESCSNSLGWGDSQGFGFGNICNWSSGTHPHSTTAPNSTHTPIAVLSMKTVVALTGCTGSRAQYVTAWRACHTYQNTLPRRHLDVNAISYSRSLQLSVPCAGP